MNSLIDTIRDRIKQAMRDKNAEERDLLRVALGEIQTEEARHGEQDDAAVEKVLRKVLKSLRETLAVVDERGDADQAATAGREIAIIESLLPKTLSENEIRDALAPVLDAIRGADRDGVATGIAMKHLKQAGAAVDGKTVTSVVTSLRAG